MSAGWRHADFADRVGEEVTLYLARGDAVGAGVRATLAACSEAVHIGDFVSYRVSLVAGPAAHRQQGVFLVEVSGRDPEPVFLVPVRELGDHLEYEAVFNQSVENRSSREHSVHR